MLARHLLKQGLLLRSSRSVGRANYHHGHHKHSTMNDMPVPAGDWKEQATRLNSRYNAILAVGVLALAGTIGFVKTSGVIDLNYSPPQSLD